MSKKIWWVHHSAITPDRPGGTRHFDFVTELKKLGHDVTVFACDINLATRERVVLGDKELYRRQDEFGLDWVWVNAASYKKNNWRRALNMWTFGQNFRKVAKKLSKTEQPDVIIGSSPHLFAAHAAMKEAKRLDAKFVLELRDLWPEALVDMGEVTESSKVVRYFRMIERQIYAGADEFVLLAAGASKYLEDRGIPKERIHVIPNGVHLDHFKASISRDKERSKLGFEGFTAVYTGAHGPANSLKTVVEAARLLEGKGINFVLIGDGTEKNSLKAQAQDLSNVRMLDPVPKENIPNVMKAADAGIISLQNIPAFQYAVSPNKLFDYMGAGLPILCSIPGDMAQVVDRAGAGLLCEPENPQDLADKAVQLAGMTKEERARLGSAGQDCASTTYSRQVLAKKLDTILNSLPSRN